MDFLKPVMVPVHKEGLKFIAIAVVATVAGGLLHHFLFYVCLTITAWCIYFFRDPIRAVPQLPGTLISPADGVVQMITKAAPPPELGMDSTERTRISIFMSPFNVHVNRSPINATIKKIAYHEGKFFNASLDKASEHNERNTLVLHTEDGKEIIVVQIAGLIARRIVGWVKEEQALTAGERFGLIRFGSRVDVYLPDGVKPKVVVGQTTLAGETILATLTGKQSDSTAVSI